MQLLQQALPVKAGLQVWQSNRRIQLLLVQGTGTGTVPTYRSLLTLIFNSTQQCFGSAYVLRGSRSRYGIGKKLWRYIGKVGSGVAGTQK